MSKLNGMKDKIEKILNERYPSAPTYNYAVAHEIEDLFLNDNACISSRKQITKQMIEEYMTTLEPAAKQEHYLGDKILWNACLRILVWLEGRD